MKVTRRRRVMDADPPTEDCPFYTIRYKDRAWQVEQAKMLDLYELKAISDPDADLL